MSTCFFQYRNLSGMGGGNFFKVGKALVHVKKSIEKFCGLYWQL